MTEKRPRVLIVEDDESIRLMVSEALKDEAYEVRNAENGEDALSILHEWRPDVIVLDLVMPRLDGEQFAAERRHVEGAGIIPLILVSATRSDDLPTIADQIGADAHFAKPFQLDAFLNTVDRLTTRETPTV